MQKERIFELIEESQYLPELSEDMSRILNILKNPLDADIDIEKYLDINTQYIKFRKELDFEKLIPAKNATLRFRKLGQHKALGMYYPAYKCLCVDIHSTSSFLHELGHYIDFERNALSMQKEFLPVLLKYKEVFNSKRNAGEKVPDYYKRKLGYFFTPTEVFARCFEIYIVVIKKYSNSFTKTIDFMKSSIPYPICSKSFIEMIDNYFSNFCDVKIEKFSDEEVFNNIENLSSRRMAAKKIVENVSDNIELNVLENGQVAFF